MKTLEDENGSLVEGDKDLLLLATNYFKDLFASKLVQNCESLMIEI